MGMPLKSNVFLSGTPEQRYFARFPLQVAVLYSPQDREFAETFREAFLELDRITGEHVIFFAVLDPPEEWLNAAKQRSWWREYISRIGVSGFSYDQKMLTYEIARLFGIPWNSLPIIVVSTNLWSCEFIASPTSPFHLIKQLTSLAGLAAKWRKPDLGLIYDHLAQSFGFELHYNPANFQARNRLSNLYSYLDIGTSNNSSRFKKKLLGELRSIRSDFGRGMHSNIKQYHQSAGHFEGIPYIADTSFDAIAADAQGRLVAPACVDHHNHFIKNGDKELFRDMSALELFCEESGVMINTSLITGQFLRKLWEDYEFNEKMLAPHHGKYRDRENIRGLIDFSACSQGAWKALELEMNLSIIQAARCARCIKFPEYFAEYAPDVADDRSTIFVEYSAGQYAPKNINRRDFRNKRSKPQRHEFLTLGDGILVIRTMSGNSDECFDRIVTNACGNPLTPQFIADLIKVKNIRNKGSHTHSLEESEFSAVINIVLSHLIMAPMKALRNKLSAGRF